MTKRIIPNNYGWSKPQGMPSHAYNCGFCGKTVSSVRGYKVGTSQDGSGKQVAAIYICPHCGGPTFIDIQGNQLPDVAFGSPVGHVPDKLNSIYDEARKCTSNSAYTAAILLCRKMLMHIGVE